MLARLPHQADQGTSALATRIADTGEVELAVDMLRSVPGFTDWQDGASLAAKFLMSIGRFDEADAALADVLGRWPDDAGALICRLRASRMAGRLDLAAEQLREAIAISGETLDLVLESALLAALGGNGALFMTLADKVTRMAGADPEYEWRLQAGYALAEEWPRFFEVMAKFPDQRAPKLLRSLPVLERGAALDGLRVLVIGDFGLGDVIQFSRYLKDLASRGCAVFFQTRPNLHRLFQTLPAEITCVDLVESIEPFDVRCSLYALPHVLGLDDAQTLHQSAYLRPKPDLVAAWRERLPHAGLRVGLVWAGNPRNIVDLGRSTTLDALGPLFADPEITFVALQKGPQLAQAQTAGLGRRLFVPADFDDGPDAFLDTAAVMANLDIVVSTDTSPAHLAGALGKPAIVMAKSVPDWRWYDVNGIAHWYPTVEVLRQHTVGDWGGLAARVFDRLQDMKRTRAPT